MDLTPQQLAVVNAPNTDIIVSAGAGSGKTTVLVERYIHLVMAEQAPPSQILALTFTEKAAHEMERRIFARLKECRQFLRENCRVSTIHSFCYRFLRQYGPERWVSSRIFSEGDSRLQLDTLLRGV